jgi:hypothetical protein
VPGVDDKLKRVDAVRAAIASARIEGREPTPKTLALLDRFIAGEITIEQALEVTKHLRR